MWNKFFSGYFNSIVLPIIILPIIIMFWFMYKVNNFIHPQIQKNNVVETIDKPMPPAENTKNQIIGNKDDLVAFSIMPNTKVHGVVSYRGIVKGGYFFEGNILVNILDMNKNVLLKSNGTAKDDWMTTSPVNFEGNIDFSKVPVGPAYLEIHNDNASGLPENDKSILVPIIIE